MSASVPRATSLVLALPILLAGCLQSGADRELGRLALRVDSLAITVTAMNAALAGQGAPAKAESLTVVAAGAAALGRADAPVTIVEFTDYQCPFCARHASTTLKELKRDHVDSGTVRYVLRDMPLTQIHPLAARAAAAARCAGAQSPELYWAYHEELFKRQKSLGDSSFSQIAAAVKLNPAQFSTCLASDQIAAAVRDDAAGATAVGLSGTPAFVIGRTRPDGRVSGLVIRGAYPYERFQAAIEAALEPAAIAARR